MLTRTLKGLIVASTVAAAALLSFTAAHADDLKSIQESKEIRIAMSGQYSPSALPTSRTRLSDSTPPSVRPWLSGWA